MKKEKTTSVLDLVGGHERVEVAVVKVAQCPGNRRCQARANAQAKQALPQGPGLLLRYQCSGGCTGALGLDGFQTPQEVAKSSTLWFSHVLRARSVAQAVA